MWTGFLSNALLFADGPVVLADVGDRIRAFLEPVYSSIVRNAPLQEDWPPGWPLGPSERGCRGR